MPYGDAPYIVNASNVVAPTEAIGVILDKYNLLAVMIFLSALYFFSFVIMMSIVKMIIIARMTVIVKMIAI